MIRVLSIAVLLLVGITARAADNGGLRQQVERLQAEVDALHVDASTQSTGSASGALKLPQLYDANGSVIGPIISAWVGGGLFSYLPVPYQLPNGKVIQLSATTSQLTVMTRSLVYATPDCTGPAYVQSYVLPPGGWLIEPALASQLPDGSYVYGNGVDENITVEATLPPGGACTAEAQSSARVVQAVVPFDPGLDQFAPPFSVRIP